MTVADAAADGLRDDLLEQLSEHAPAVGKYSIGNCECNISIRWTIAHVANALLPVVEAYAAAQVTKFVPVTRGVMNRYLHVCGFIEHARQDIDEVQAHLRCRACKAAEPGGWSVLFTFPHPGGAP